MKRLQRRLKYETESALDRILEILFLPRCFVCDRLLDTLDIRAGRKIHRVCRGKLEPVKQPFCFHCGCPLPDEGAEYCSDCRRKHSCIEQGRALFVYGGTILKSMYRFKYANRRRYAAFLAEEAAARYGDWFKEKEIEVIVPVPMFRKKKRQRGYNQAELFARKISEYTGIPCKSHMVRRIRNTLPQKELGDREREKNVKSAFQISDFVVQHKKILIVDDIYTTGATVEAVAEVLHKAGVEQIYVLSACIGKGF